MWKRTAGNASLSSTFGRINNSLRPMLGLVRTMIRPTQKVRRANTGAKQPFSCRKPNVCIQNGIWFITSPFLADPFMWCSLPLKISQVRSPKSNLPSPPTTHSGVPHHQLCWWRKRCISSALRSALLSRLPVCGTIDRRSCNHTVFFVLSSDTIVHSIL